MLIATTFITKYQYPFWKFNHKPQPDFNLFKAWYNSITDLRIKAVILHDELPQEFIDKHSNGFVGFKKVEHKSQLNPVDERWGIYYNYLLNNIEDEVVFFTDLTDVKVLGYPCPKIDTIYIGNEEIKVASGWMNQRFALLKDQNYITEFKQQHGNKKLLNCGIFGGYKETIINPILDIANFLKENEVKNDTVDMCAANIVLYSKYEQQLFYGEPLNTEFWKEDVNNKTCWFKHK
jgi:hypothetical protein